MVWSATEDCVTPTTSSSKSVGLTNGSVDPRILRIAPGRTAIPTTSSCSTPASISVGIPARTPLPAGRGCRRASGRAVPGSCRHRSRRTAGRRPTPCRPSLPGRLRRSAPRCRRHRDATRGGTRCHRSTRLAADLVGEDGESCGAPPPPPMRHRQGHGLGFAVAASLSGTGVVVARCRHRRQARQARAPPSSGLKSLCSSEHLLGSFRW